MPNSIFYLKAQCEIANAAVRKRWAKVCVCSNFPVETLSAVQSVTQFLAVLQSCCCCVTADLQSQTSSQSSQVTGHSSQVPGLRSQETQQCHHHGVRRASLPDPGQERGGWGAPPAPSPIFPFPSRPGGGPPLLPLMAEDVQSAERPGGQSGARPDPPRQQPEHHLA